MRLRLYEECNALDRHAHHVPKLPSVEIEILHPLRLNKPFTIANRSYHHEIQYRTQENSYVDCLINLELNSK